MGAAEPQGGDFGSLWWASDLSNVTTSHSHCHRPFLDPKLVLRQSMLSMSDSSSSDYSDEESAIEWLLSQQGNQLLVRVDEDYIEDAFNLYGLNKVIPNFRDTLRLLLTTAEDAEICLEDDHRGPCYQTLLDLYGLIHARYILTTPGMNKLRRKLQNGVYGCCPNHPDPDAEPWPPRFAGLAGTRHSPNTATTRILPSNLWLQSEEAQRHAANCV